MVFTNGCFDLIHPGHVIYLEEARALGDCLVLGLNTDRSVRELKGRGRPVASEIARAWVLTALRAVDYVVLFDEPDAARVDYRDRSRTSSAREGDYRPEDVVGKDVVERRGGRVEILAFHPGFSTTELVQRIQQLPSAEG